MAEVKYESKISKSAASARAIFAVLSDLSNIDKVRDLIPQDKIKDIESERDFVRFKVDGLGQKICVRVVDREEDKTVKFAVEGAPVTANMWIQMKQVEENDTRLKLTMKSDFPMMFKMMLDKKIQTGLDEAAEMLAQMPFEEWSRN